MQIQMQIGGSPPQTYAAGQTCNNPRGDNSGAFVFMEGGGKYQEPTARGLTYTGFSAIAGVNIPQYSSTVQQFVLTNPAGSGVAAVLKSWTAGFVGGPTPVAGLTMLCGANYAAVGVAQPTTATLNSIFNNETQILAGSKIFCHTNSTVTAPLWWKPSGLTVWTTTGGNTPVGTTQFGEELDGSLILKPGQWCAVAANVATFGTAVISATWLEVPQGWVN